MACDIKPLPKSMAPLGVLVFELVWFFKKKQAGSSANFKKHGLWNLMAQKLPETEGKRMGKKENATENSDF